MHSRDEYREIITDAVCGRGSKYSQHTYTIHTANRPTTIGGCWVMNHSCEGVLIGETVEVRGRFDTNVWYSYNDNSETAVAKDTVSYVEQINLQGLDPNCSLDDLSVHVKVKQEPNCVDATIVDDHSEILVRVEIEWLVEVIGPTKVWVLTMTPSHKKDSFDVESSLLEESSL
ncbi:outer spore coat protein CotE [Ferroacidibacillus organovorans]|uniref:Spore coat protein n=1 Tax=Ferroacidibacillus organovorans TaxID=1765683 RepID=A0A101XT14_9BACL|nr:outer spore coat protein CotE [Ferroacidibacillus organovorans]KUO97013.1 spore coat protein [Ferroacidibacillus organovorans]